MNRRNFIIVCLCLVVHAATASGADTITFESLLNEMVDRTAITEFPDPAYTCKQFSSYDRKSTSPEDQESWYANADYGQFIRSEQYDDDNGTEYVMMDAAGPGAVVRIWSANPKGNIRIYLDDNPKPVIAMPMAEAIGGTGIVSSPLSAVRSRGHNLYMPIPYAKKCIITSDASDFYYQINYRTYEPTTAVKSFSLTDLETHSELLQNVQAQLINPALVNPAGTRQNYTTTVMPGDEAIFWQKNGSTRITQISMFAVSADMINMLRSGILIFEFDNGKNVECPIGDFFGSSPGFNTYNSWWFSVVGERQLISRWIMPFAKNAQLRIRNEGFAPLSIAGEVYSEPYTWNENSMYFCAGWHIESDIPTQPRRDWNYFTLKGKGVYVGDSLSVTNPVENWWGEGDEKIYVDNETFPSHFGTGTEDYYGYAWCCPETFNAPLHNQTRCDGPGNYGFTSVNRFRALDAIPFTENFKFDMEVWHWADCNITYAATTYWYAKPGTYSNIPEIMSSWVKEVKSAPPLPPPFKIENAIEGEALKITSTSETLQYSVQNLDLKNTFSNDKHLWVRATKIGDFIEFDIPVKDAGSYNITVYLTKSWDYGIVKFYIDGVAAVAGGVEIEPVDTFNTAGRTIAATGPIDLGNYDEKAGETLKLRIEVTGSNKNSDPPHYYFGLDAVKISKSTDVN